MAPEESLVVVGEEGALLKMADETTDRDLVCEGVRVCVSVRV